MAGERVRAAGTSGGNWDVRSRFRVRCLFYKTERDRLHVEEFMNPYREELRRYYQPRGMNAAFLCIMPFLSISKAAVVCWIR